MTPLSEKWKEVGFNDVFDIKGGSQPPKSEFVASPRPGYVRLLQIRDFDSDEKAVYIPVSPKWPMCSEHDIMIGRYGASVGKILGGKAGAYNVALVRVLLDEARVDRAWARYFFKSDRFQRCLTTISRSAQNGFNKEDLASIRVSLPPLSVQRQVVIQLDKWLASSNKARVELDHASKLIVRYKRAILATALQGSATTDWRSANSTVGSNHLIDVGSKSAVKRSGGNAGAGSVIATPLPETWRYASIDSIGEVILGRQRSPENHTGPDMRSYVRSANVTWLGWDLSDVKQMNFDEADFKKFRLKPGDVVINEGSGSASEVGKPAIWSGEIADCCFQNTLIVIRPRATTPEFLYFVLYNAAVSKAFVDEARGVNIHHIGRAGLAQFIIAVPPLEEQREIACAIASAFKRIEGISSDVYRAGKLLDRFNQALMTKAFGAFTGPGMHAGEQQRAAE